MRTIRASEIGTFLYCQRAWWYQRKDVPSENVAEMATGTEIHRKHGRSVVAAGCFRTIAIGLLMASLLMVVAHMVVQVLG